MTVNVTSGYIAWCAECGYESAFCLNDREAASLAAEHHCENHN